MCHIVVLTKLPLVANQLMGFPFFLRFSFSIRRLIRIYYLTRSSHLTTMSVHYYVRVDCTHSVRYNRVTVMKKESYHEYAFDVSINIRTWKQKSFSLSAHTQTKPHMNPQRPTCLLDFDFGFGCHRYVCLWPKDNWNCIEQMKYVTPPRKYTRT